MERTWKPVAAGVLMIIAGAFWGVGGGSGVLNDPFSQTFWWFFETWQFNPGLIVAGAVAIVGGVFALQRRLWPMALAGSILALPCMGLFGLLSIIWVAQSRKEFAGYK